MKLLLTSAGVTNPSIESALVQLLEKPIADSRAVLIPTAIYGEENGNSFAVLEIQQLLNLGWQDLAILELTTLKSLYYSSWINTLTDSDVIIMGGGNGWYLSYWLEKTDMFNILPGVLEDKVYMGISAGSAMATHELQFDKQIFERSGVLVDRDFGETAIGCYSARRTFDFVPILFRPHWNSSEWPAAKIESFKETAQLYSHPTYVIDDQTAIKVINGSIEIVSEGQWQIIEPSNMV